MLGLRITFQNQLDQYLACAPTTADTAATALLLRFVFCTVSGASVGGGQGADFGSLFRGFSIKPFLTQVLIGKKGTEIDIKEQ